ncbi:MAG: diguanylate cyclase [Deltaproteobacteria bacterium]|nr:diguanylate cyclase [Deltaproteobacteria bacterium]
MNAHTVTSPRRVGLRVEVGVLVAVISVVASAGAGILAYRQMAELTDQAGIIHATAVLDALSAPAAVAIAAHDFPKLDNFVAELVAQRSTDVLFMEVVDPDGRVLATSQTGMVGVQEGRFEEGFMTHALDAQGTYFAFGPDREAPRYLDVAKPVILGQRWGTLVARFSLEPFSDRLVMLKRTVIALAALSALLGWVVTIVLLERVVVRPVRKLASMARRLGEGELDIRTAYQRRDEIGELGMSLNTMARRLERYTTGLEGAVRERTADLEAANQELKRLATTDGLTGLRNHRFFQDTLEFELKRASRHPHPLTLCMLDVDHFKTLNDTHGHPVGDEALRTLARALERRLRATDIVARYGGEEFAIVLLDTDAAGGLAFAETLAEVVRETDFPGAETQPLGRLSVSIGVATFPSDAADRAQLIRRADAALYEAKRQGRDRVVRWHEGLVEGSLEARPFAHEEEP